ncbi:PepSY domain-containing protein [Ignisphaera sp. 4213-co]|uniref:PepSY domain-containing protein n=1 Tax=Ignisphaera cupida TaxID=3050454 RepID=A0ABD4Z761_9CREN|nr:PepSY domain-containing protein [Ignisphaera sp. 4213-co]MDK6028842.1 PepSY domain-containing protein [Ignisphaera sp. 4213-co]
MVLRFPPKIFALLSLILTLIAIGIVAYTAISPNQGFRNISNETSKPRYELPIIIIDSDKASVKISLEEAMRMVSRIWDVPKSAPSARVIIDKIEGRTYWSLGWVENSGKVYAMVDAETGQVVLLHDFRYKAKMDNLKNRARAVEIAVKLLEKLGIPTHMLTPEPSVLIERAPADGPVQEITYEVMWKQVYKGIQVIDGYVIVSVDPENQRPVGFVVKLLDVENISVEPKITRDSAVAIATEFLKSRGYSLGEVAEVKLCIGRPNYYWEGKPIIRGPPSLLWIVVFKKPYSDSGTVEVWVDAHSGVVVGGDKTRC